MHLAVDFDVLHHFLAIGFQTAVEIVQVLDSAHAAGRGVEQLGRQGFRQGVVAFLLIPRNEVVALIGDHVIEGGDLVGRILQVCVHRDDDVALRGAEATEKGWRLAVVAAELDAMDIRVAAAQSFDDFP